MKVYVAIVQRPMASLDDTLVAIFPFEERAWKWIDMVLADERYCEGFNREEMNWDVFEREVDEHDPKKVDEPVQRRHLVSV